MDAFLIYPDPDPNPLAEGYAVFSDTLRSDDGHPQMGKELAGHLERAGFADIRVSAAFEVFSGPERLRLVHDLSEQWYFEPDFQRSAVQYGAVDTRMLDEIRKATDAWRRSTGAVVAFAYGEALGVKP